jgi:hypothetical protein
MEVGSELVRGGQETYPALLSRLSEHSVAKHYDAFADIAWDDEAFAIRADDPRWILPRVGLGASAWYCALDPATRARLGLHVVVTTMTVGVQFENILTRGLLKFVARLPPDNPEARYGYHEIIEESQHSLMFQEFVRRSGLRAPGMTGVLAKIGERVVNTAAWFPELFFVFVLGGEDPIDHAQRDALASDRNHHPLAARIMKIHVTEEARHLCFARAFLREHVPRLGRVRRALLGLLAPIILGVMAEIMMRPSRHLQREYAIPDVVIDDVYGSAEHRQRTQAALRKVRDLCDDLGLITFFTRPLWRLLGPWSAA